MNIVTNLLYILLQQCMLISYHHHHQNRSDHQTKKKNNLCKWLYPITNQAKRHTCVFLLSTCLCKRNNFALQNPAAALASPFSSFLSGWLVLLFYAYLRNITHTQSQNASMVIFISIFFVEQKEQPTNLLFIKLFFVLIFISFEETILHSFSNELLIWQLLNSVLITYPLINQTSGSLLVFLGEWKTWKITFVLFHATQHVC